MGCRILIVLDTHAWVWWATDAPQLSDTAREHIEAAPRLGVSPMSCWEVASLVRRGRLGLTAPVGPWIAAALSRDRVELLPLSPATAIFAGSLAEPFPGDPADRLIYATALTQEAQLVTKDARIRDFDPDRTVW